MEYRVIHDCCPPVPFTNNNRITYTVFVLSREKCGNWGTTISNGKQMWNVTMTFGPFSYVLRGTNRSEAGRMCMVSFISASMTRRRQPSRSSPFNRKGSMRQSLKSSDRKHTASVAANLRPGHARGPVNRLEVRCETVQIRHDIPTLNAVTASSPEWSYHREGLNS